MKKLRPRTKPAQERRDELMNAAQQLFLGNGLAYTSIEQITTAADVAKGTFYLHFSSKEDVLLALRDRFVRELLESIQAAVAKVPEGDWKGKLAAWATAGINYFLDTAAVHNLVFREYQSSSPDHSKENAIVGHLSELLQGGALAGVWAVDDCHFTATFLFHGLHGVVHDGSVGESRTARKRLSAKLQQACFLAVGLPFETNA